MTFKIKVQTVEGNYENTFEDAVLARQFINDIEYSRKLARVSNKPLLLIPVDEVVDVMYDGDYAELNTLADDIETARWKEQRAKDKSEEAAKSDAVGLTLTEIKVD